MTQPTPSKDNSTVIAIASFIVVILVAITLMIAIDRARLPDQNTYNNFQFVRAGNMWLTEWQNDGQLYRVPLRFHPTEVEDIPISGSLDPQFEQQQIYISFDPRIEILNLTGLAAAELSINLRQVFGITPQAACVVNETDACATRPILDCSSNASVIVLQNTPESSITMDGTCITIAGSEWGLVKSVDRLLYDLYNIIP